MWWTNRSTLPEVHQAYKNHTEVMLKKNTNDLA